MMLARRIAEPDRYGRSGFWGNRVISTGGRRHDQHAIVYRCDDLPRKSHAGGPGCDEAIRRRSRIAMGVHGEEKPSSALFFPFALIADIQREYFKQLWRLWNSMFLQMFAGGAHSSVALAQGDKRFKDASWREQPYYDLLKQSCLLGSRQLYEFVDRAQVDDKTSCSFGFMPGSLSMR